MYRMAKKTTKKTKGYCLKCKFHKEITSVLIECTAENKCFQAPFNPNDFYCIEYKGFSDMSDKKINDLADEIYSDYLRKQYAEFAKKYYPRKTAKQMIAYNDFLVRAKRNAHHGGM